MAEIRGTRKAKRRKAEGNRYTVAMIVMTAILVASLGVLVFFLVRDTIRDNPKKPTETLPSENLTADASESGTVPESQSPSGTVGEILVKARRMAGSYDYDAAVSYVKEKAPNYEAVPELAAFVSECAAKKAQLVKWADNSKIGHVFFHTLVADFDKAFGSYKRNDYNEVMTTIPEFNKIIQSMYENGYVLVHLSDIAKIEKQPDGTEKMVWQPIYLPAGKTPFVLSVDDVSYYEYMNNTGFATRLVIDETGRVVNEMDIYEEIGVTGLNDVPNLKRDENGAPIVKSTVRGDFDVVPILDRFVEEHPDFSYHGAKGTIALTGYNGILGYKTSEIAYGAGDPNWPSAYEYHNVNIEADREKAREVADAMKANGWKFASHTWGHMRMESVVDKEGTMTGVGGKIIADRFTRDTTWWLNEVAPLIGGTDIIIFAYGSDIGSWKGYTETNEAYRYLKDRGFNYFCNVDGSTLEWVQKRESVAGDSGYLRQGRVNLDGMFMLKMLMAPYGTSENSKKLAEEVNKRMFNVKEVFDRRRPLTMDANGRVIGLKVPDALKDSSGNLDTAKLFGN